MQICLVSILGAKIWIIFIWQMSRSQLKKKYFQRNRMVGRLSWEKILLYRQKDVGVQKHVRSPHTNIKHKQCVEPQLLLFGLVEITVNYKIMASSRSNGKNDDHSVEVNIISFLFNKINFSSYIIWRLFLKKYLNAYFDVIRTPKNWINEPLNVSKFEVFLLESS